MFVMKHSVNPSFNVNRSFFVTQCGYEDCKPKHSYGPTVRDYYLLHFVFSGKGVLQINGKSYELTKGQGFFIPLGTPTTYTADENDPWFYGWVGFSGESSNQQIALRGLSNDKIVFNFNDSEYALDLFKKLVNSFGSEGNGFYTISKLFEIFSLINPEHDSSNLQSGIINEVIIDIEKNYASDVTVEELSKKYNISRSQLFRLFKTKLDISPQQYIKHYRINHAADLLRRTDLTIGQVMEQSGFSNISNFSRQFKSVYGRSPKDFREYIKNHVKSLENPSSDYYE